MKRISLEQGLSKEARDEILVYRKFIYLDGNTGFLIFKRRNNFPVGGVIYGQELYSFAPENNNVLYNVLYNEALR